MEELLAGVAVVRFPDDLSSPLIKEEPKKKAQTWRFSVLL